VPVPERSASAAARASVSVSSAPPAPKKPTGMPEATASSWALGLTMSGPAAMPTDSGSPEVSSRTGTPAALASEISAA